MSRWFAFALEGTLAQPSNSRDLIGVPVPDVIAKARELADAGKDVRILTERANNVVAAQQARAWLQRVGLAELPLVAACDSDMAVLFQRPNALALSDSNSTNPDADVARIARQDKSIEAPMRMGVMCPHCHGVANIRTSRQVSALLREVYCQCRDVTCGYTFKASLEAVQGLSPSGRPNPEIARQIDAHVEKISGEECAEERPR